MMTDSKTTVLLLGATGETGKNILDGLREDGNFVSWIGFFFTLHCTRTET